MSELTKTKKPVYDWIAQNWRSLIRPRGVKVEDATLSETYGKFACEPLEGGFAHTLGNSLRRVLLSSLQGTAVVAVKIDGVLHEFTTVPKVVEDVAEIILNLKGVIFKKDNPFSEVTLHIEKEGPGEVTASDIQVVNGIEIVNPFHHICTLDEGGRISMDIRVRSGKGYVRAETHQAHKELGVGWVPVDAIFSPIRKVNYTVRPARVGDRTDYDSLRLEIWTDGSVHPVDAMSYAAKILKEHVQIFITFEEEEEPVSEEEHKQEEEINKYLFKRVDELELSVRASNCLRNANIEFIGQLVQRTEQEMLKTKNFGRKSLKEIKDILAEMGLHLGMSIPWWPKDGLPPQLQVKEDSKNE